MNKPTACPDGALLEELLIETLPTDQQATLETHIEACRLCQQRLAELAACDEPWPGAARSLQGAFDDDKQAVAHVIDRLKERVPPAGASPTAAKVTLDFLEPVSDADCLGRLGAYDIQDIVGRGGMGVVLRGFDRKLDRVVAIKVLAPEFAAHATARRRFAPTRPSRLFAACATTRHVRSARSIPRFRRGWRRRSTACCRRIPTTDTRAPLKLQNCSASIWHTSRAPVQFRRRIPMRPSRATAVPGDTRGG